MTEKLMKYSKRYRRFAQFFAIGSSFILIISIIFFSLFRIFERITYDSIADLNRDFAIQIDTLTETINSSIVNFGMQLYYSDTVKRMMGTEEFSNTERVYMTRDLNTALSSSDFAEAILIYNGHTGHIYSTDPSYPDQMIDSYNHIPIKNLLLSRTKEQRFKPIYCEEQSPSGKEYYTFLFYEIYPGGEPKPNTLVVTVKSEWYKKSLLAANPSSDLIVINKSGSVLVSASDFLRQEYLKYYPMITEEKNSGYFIDRSQNEICMFYESLITGHTYMKISSLTKTLPRLFYFRKIVIYFLATIIFIFAAALGILLLLTLLPMRQMRDAINTIDELLTGEMPESQNMKPSISPIPLKEQIDAVVSKSERASLEQLFYDMLAEKTTLDPDRLFKTQEGLYGLMLILAKHRKDIYEIMEKTHPEVIVTKSAHIYACIGRYLISEDYETLAETISSQLGCQCFLSPLFDKFDSLTGHFNNLTELKKLSFLLNEKEQVIREERLFEQSSVNTITTKDFTELIVKLKAGNLEASRAKWQEILQTILNYRFDDVQYILYRAEDTVCNVLGEFSSDFIQDGQKLLPESLEQIQSIEEIDRAFDRAFVAICDNYSVKKAEKYSELAGQIKKLVQESYHDSSLNSQKIADMIHMNNAYLGRLFKSSYGRSINDYINTCRIEEGMRLLKETELSVEEIAQQVGFSNIKYFYVLFKKATGITPAKYRTQPQEMKKTAEPNQTIDSMDREDMI